MSTAHPTTSPEIALALWGFVATRFAPLGYIPICASPVTTWRVIERLLRHGRDPIHIDISLGILARMARVLGRVIADTLAKPSRGNRQRVAELSARFAVALFASIAKGERVAKGTEDAVFDALRYINETILQLPPCEPWRARTHRPAALDGITDRKTHRGARTLAAALRQMYGIRTARDFAMEHRWVVAGAGIALLVGGCVAAR